MIATGISLGGTTQWPQLRGPAGDGQVTGTELFSGPQSGLALAWRVPLGPGYSGIAVAEGRAVTLFSDGTDDLVLAVDTSTGKELWRHKLAPTNKAHDGSDGGPGSTPAIHGDLVYALGPKGQFVALRLADGSEVWSKLLSRDFGGREPDYGFTTSPVIAGDVVVVQTGGDAGRALSGLDARTGETLWSLGDQDVEYQSPAFLKLAGEKQVIAISGHQINGIAARSGKVLWEHALEEDEGVDSSNILPLGDDGFLTFVSGTAVRFKVSKSDDGYQVEEVYRSKDLGGTYALPVSHDGHLYGFKGQFLTCVEAETGKVVWKSRPPGGRGLILIDGHLVVYAAKGNIVVVKATPDGYMETARLHVLEGSGYTWPSFADDTVFVRNLSEMAAVTITAQQSGPLGDQAAAGGRAAEPKTAFSAFVHRVEMAENKQPLIDGFLAGNKQLPVVDGEYIHFVYEGAVDDIAISGNMIEGGAAEAMERIDGTDFYYKTYRLIPASHLEYRFNIDFEKQVLDPRNEESVPANFGDVGWSVVSLGDGAASPYLEEPPAGHLRGTVETLKFKDKAGGDEREIRVYLPAGYGEGDRTYPLLVVHGLDWLDKGLLGNVLDNMIGESIEPLVVAMVAPRQEWWTEAGGTGTGQYVDLLAGEIVPFLQGKYRLRDEAASRGVMGSSYFGLTALYASMKHPEVFGKAAVLSANLGLGADDEVMALIKARKADNLLLYMGWNRYEQRDPDNDVDSREDNLNLAQFLEEHGYSFTGGEALDAYGWGSWRARADDFLVALYPAK
ncbi:MAG: PQQ-binding-like beta-propeller repeat protein [Acidobacteria bacterium]|nr:PQQ-binding-like beta-propeller repeat protein [Acidobacteriota bacterium]